MVRNRQEIEGRLYFNFGPVIGMYHRFAFGKAVGRIGVSEIIAKQVGIIGQVAVQVGVAPEQLIRIILCVNRSKDNDY